MYLVVRKYKNVTGNQQELQNKINNGFVPLIREIDGFVDYYCISPDDSSLLSVGVFQDEKGANESVKAAADWVAKNIAKFLPEKPEVISGDVFTTHEEQGSYKHFMPKNGELIEKFPAKQ